MKSPQYRSHVIICADDYAMTAGVSRGILTLSQNKRINATSCMTNRPHWPEWSEALKPLRDHLAVGLHLNFTLGTPLTAYENGRFSALKTLLIRALTHQLSYDAIRAEIAAQLDAFIAEMHTPPDFIDGHQHIHVLPVIRKALLDECLARGWQGRVWLRDPSDTIYAIMKRHVSYGKALFVKALAMGFATRAHRFGFKTNHGFSGFRAFDETREFLQEFEYFVQYRGQAHLVMCHPGGVDDELVKLGEVTTPRQQELDALMSDQFIALLQRHALECESSLRIS